MAYDSKTKSNGKEKAQKEPDGLREDFTSDLKEARAFMEPIQQQMDRDYDAYRNYMNQKEEHFKISDFFAYVETTVPIITNNRIRANVSSDYPDYVTHAKGLNDILDNTYDINNWDYMSQEVMRQALIYRSSYVYTGYDKEHKNGTGKLCINNVNPRWCMVDPSTTELDDSRFFFYVEPMRKTQVYKMYPFAKDKIEESLNTKGEPGSKGSWFKTWLGSVKNWLLFNNTNTTAKQVYYPGVQPEISEQDKHKNVIAYIHYWYRGDDDEWCVAYFADDVFLKQEENPFWHGCLPYDILSPIKDPLSMLGIPMNEQIDSMSVQRNEMMQYIVNNGKLHGNPPLLYNTTMGNVKDPQKLNEQAQGTGIIPINNPDMVPLNAIAEYMSVPVMPGYVTGIFDHLGALQDKITGVNDSFRGTQQASSGKEVQLQQEAAYTRIKTMIDRFELCNKKMAEKIIINAMQFLNQNRAFRIKGDYTKYEQPQQTQPGQQMPGMEQPSEQLPFEIKKVPTGVNQETGEPQFSKTEFFLYANPNEWTKLKPDEEDMEDEEDKKEMSTEEYASYKDAEKGFRILQMTVEIEAGSSLPQSRLARREEAMELFTAGAIDQESLLDMFDWADRDKVIKRMQEKQQQMAQVQAQTVQAETQGKMQLEQAKGQTQIQIEQMKIQGDLTKTHATNQANIQKQQMSNQGQAVEQGMQNTGGSMAEMIDKIRQDNPEAANMSDEELIAALTGAQQAPEQGGGLAQQLDQIRQQNPEAANLSDEELIQALQGGGQ